MLATLVTLFVCRVFFLKKIKGYAISDRQQKSNMDRTCIRLDDFQRWLVSPQKQELIRLLASSYSSCSAIDVPGGDVDPLWSGFENLKNLVSMIRRQQHQQQERDDGEEKTVVPTNNNNNNKEEEEEEEDDSSDVVSWLDYVYRLFFDDAASASIDGVERATRMHETMLCAIPLLMLGLDELNRAIVSPLFVTITKEEEGQRSAVVNTFPPSFFSCAVVAVRYLNDVCFRLVELLDVFGSRTASISPLLLTFPIPLYEDEDDDDEAYDERFEKTLDGCVFPDRPDPASTDYVRQIYDMCSGLLGASKMFEEALRDRHRHYRAIADVVDEETASPSASRAVQAEHWKLKREREAYMKYKLTKRQHRLFHRSLTRYIEGTVSSAPSSFVTTVSA